MLRSPALYAIENCLEFSARELRLTRSAVKCAGVWVCRELRRDGFYKMERDVGRAERAIRGIIGCGRPIERFVAKPQPMRSRSEPRWSRRLAI
jgi:hypothetical protein